MADALPIVMIPGLLATPRLYAEQIPELWALGPVTVAAHTWDDSMAAIARRILESAPPRFALVGLSMGGYISFEILRIAPHRIVKLALLDTSARPDAPEQTAQRQTQVALARGGRLGEVIDMQFPRLVHPTHQGNESLRRIVRTMAEEVGVEAFARQQQAIMERADSRPGLGNIRCPTLVLVGDGDVLTPPALAAEIAEGIPGARLVTIPASGHISTLEQPRSVTQELVAHLRLQ
jgi:pimeloyl-ACP methyl ester carboxylesterase